MAEQQQQPEAGAVVEEFATPAAAAADAAAAAATVALGATAAVSWLRSSRPFLPRTPPSTRALPFLALLLSFHQRLMPLGVVLPRPWPRSLSPARALGRAGLQEGNEGAGASVCACVCVCVCVCVWGSHRTDGGCVLPRVCAQPAAMTMAHVEVRLRGSVKAPLQVIRGHLPLMAVCICCIDYRAARAGHGAACRCPTRACVLHTHTLRSAPPHTQSPRRIRPAGAGRRVDCHQL